MCARARVGAWLDGSIARSIRGLLDVAVACDFRPGFRLMKFTGRARARSRPLGYERACSGGRRAFIGLRGPGGALSKGYIMLMGGELEGVDGRELDRRRKWVFMVGDCW